MSDPSRAGSGRDRKRRVLTRNGSEHIRDEDLHQGLVHDVIAGTHPLQHRLVPAQHQQPGARQAALDLAQPAAGGEGGQYSGGVKGVLVRQCQLFRFICHMGQFSQSF